PMDALSNSLCFDTTSLAHRDAVRGERHPHHLHPKPLILRDVGVTLGRRSSMLLLGLFFLARTFFCRIDPSADPLSDLNNLTSQEAARTRRSDLVTHLG